MGTICWMQRLRITCPRLPWISDWRNSTKWRRNQQTCAKWINVDNFKYTNWKKLCRSNVGILSDSLQFSGRTIDSLNPLANIYHSLIYFFALSFTLFIVHFRYQRCTILNVLYTLYASSYIYEGGYLYKCYILASSSLILFVRWKNFPTSLLVVLRTCHEYEMCLRRYTILRALGGAFWFRARKLAAERLQE